MKKTVVIPTLSCAILLFTSTGMAQPIEGITQPYYDAILSARVPGKVAVIHFKEGDTVSKGEVLIELNKEDSRLELKRRKLIWEDKSELEAAQIRLTSEEAQLEANRRKLIWEDKSDLQSATRRSESKQSEMDVVRRKIVWEDKSELGSAEATVKMTKTDLASTRELFASTGSISQEEVDQKELTHKTATANFELLKTTEQREEVDYEMTVDQHGLQQQLAKLELKQLEISEGREEVEYRIAVDRLSSNEKLAKLDIERLKISEQREKLEYELTAEQLEMRDIVSPIDGIVEQFYLEVGANCDPRNALVRVVDTSRFYFVANIEPQDAAPLRIGQTVTLQLATDDDSAVPGEISFVSPVIDKASGLRRIKALFPNPDRAVPPGVAATLKVD
jgi:multidrug efflux pump subunit AcrA (membrane-fusion protein)